jgi:hypothetical protein
VKKILLSYLIVAVSFVMSGNVMADSWYVELDNADGDGIFDIYFVADSNNINDVVVENYQIDFQYDSSEMIFVGFTNTPPADLTPNMLGKLREKFPETPGTLTNFNAALGFDFTDLGYRATPGSRYRLGTVIFDIFEPKQVQDGLVDLWIDPASPFGGVSIDEDDDPETIANFIRFYTDFDSLVSLSGEGMDVGYPPAPVPVPGTLGLVAVGLVGLAGITRRRDDV